MNEEINAKSEDNSTQSDLRPLVRGELNVLKRKLVSAKAKR
jgi:hypothetical protein